MTKREWLQKNPTTKQRLGRFSTVSDMEIDPIYGGRIAFWYPALGINAGVSEFVNAPYSQSAGAVMSIWQPYFNYHRGNWQFNSAAPYNALENFVHGIVQTFQQVRQGLVQAA